MPFQDTACKLARLIVTLKKFLRRKRAILFGSLFLDGWIETRQKFVSVSWEGESRERERKKKVK